MAGGRGGILRSLLAGCFYYSGILALVRWATRRSGPHVILLNYHRANEGDLRAHLSYLRRHYRLLSLEAALEELYTSNSEGTPLVDRRSPLVVTFDDGYRDTFTHAFALARELRIPITIFLVPGYIESGTPFWWIEAKRIAHHAVAAKLTTGEST